MPELPEVQTIVSDLNKKIKGDTIVGFWSDWKKAIKNISAKKFGEEIMGRKILGARRIGKNIFIDLNGKLHYAERGRKTIYIHLKMTGHLLVKFKEKKSPPTPLLPACRRGRKKGESKNYFNERVNQYVRHIFYLKSQHPSSILASPARFAESRRAGRLPSPVIQRGIAKRGGGDIDYNKTLEFSDLRKFGKIVLADTDKIESLKEIKSLGIDALDRKFTLKRFRKILEKRQNSLIGIILMNQNLIAGIGNIYRSEILFDAKILPTRKIGDLNLKEIEKLFKSIKKILKKAVKMRGTSDSDYRDTAGAPGRFHKVLKVYRREKRKCKKCDTMVNRIKLGQRSVFYCSNCQR